MKDFSEFSSSLVNSDFINKALQDFQNSGVAINLPRDEETRLAFTDVVVKTSVYFTVRILQCYHNWSNSSS